jgi:hypothetical protein
MRRLSGALFITILILVLAACSQGGPEPGAEPEGPTTPDATPTLAPEEAGAAGEAIEAARNELAARLGVEPADLVVVSSNEMEWPNACLGLAEAGEMCAEVITPGWLVVLRAPGEELLYEVRTDQSGRTVRFQQAVDPGQELPLAAVRAREQLAGQLGISPEIVEVVNLAQEEWPDSCLGLPERDEMCAQVITPGWLIELEAEGRRYQAHTTREGESVRIRGADGVGRDDDLDGAAVFFEQSGGIAGIQTTYRIYASGMIEKESGGGGPDQGVSAIPVDPAAVAQLLSDLERLGFFDQTSTGDEEFPCCDFFVYELAARSRDQMASITVVETGDEPAAPEWEYIELVRIFIEKHETNPTS